MERIKLVLPKVHIDTFGEPAFFLAGPIQGGGDWQKEAIRMLHQRRPDAFIFCPCRYKEGHELYGNSVARWMEPSPGGHYRLEPTYENQTLWERHGMEATQEEGCIIFWLPAESVSDPRRDGSPYARDTYGELGEWRARIAFEHLQFARASRIPARVVIGAEPGFPGLKQIRANFKEMLPNFVFQETLEATVDAAMKLARL